MDHFVERIREPSKAGNPVVCSAGVASLLNISREGMGHHQVQRLADIPARPRQWRCKAGVVPAEHCLGWR